MPSRGCFVVHCSTEKSGSPVSESIQPNVPFIWPEPRVSAGVVAPYASLPFDEVARSSVSIFGVASAIDRQAVEWMEAYLADSAGETRMRLVVSIQPTCRTTEADLLELVRLAERYAGRAAFRVFPERSLRDRSSNLLCFSARDASAVVVLGPAENLGLGPTSPSQANIVTSVSAPTLEACRKWFDYLWGVAGPLQPEIAASMPQLVIPEGDAEAARLWREYRTRCFAQPQGGAAQPKVSVDVKTGEVTLTDHNDRPVESPTAELGVPKLDGVADGIARVFEQGLLVAVDKTSRVPPLEAPVKPEWFGVDSFKQTGMVSSKTSFKVAPFDEATLKKVDRLRRASGDILPHYTYALADGMRWIPKAAIPLFEAALTEANDAAKKLLGVTVGDDIDAFLSTQRDRIRADAQRMYEAYHPGGKIPETAVGNILDELKARLGKTRGEALIPKVAYSPVAFSVGKDTAWSSPWGQAFQLIKGVAEFPREAMTSRFFWQGVRADEDELIQAMNVAGDHLVVEYGSRKAKQRAEHELAIIKQLESSQADVRERCAALWALVTAGDDSVACELLEAAARTGAASA